MSDYSEYLDKSIPRAVVPKKTSKEEQMSFEFMEEEDAINPSYYKSSYPFEVIDLIKKTLTPEQFIGFCLGNEIKYRMRAGIKTDKVQQDIDKALWYNKARKEVQ